MEPYAKHGDWIQKERNGFWKNTVTGESTIWHPVALSIGGETYNKASKWCRKAADDRNKRTKDK